jgi:GLPGLI family protein
MKKLIVACFIATVLITSLAQGQQKEGRVVYERTSQIQIRFNVAGGEEGVVERAMPKTRTDKMEILFGNNQSLRKPIVDDTPDESSFEGNGMVIRTFNAGADDILYINFNDGHLVEQCELATKKYLVTDTVRKLNWKLTGETKSILGFACQQATTQRISSRMMMNIDNGQMKREEVPDTINITAWFAPAIPVSAGPEYQGQLPGLILALDINNGRTVIKALEVSPKVDVASIKEPKGGKKITQEEFAKERDKMMEEMQRNNGGGRRTTIRVGS